MQRHFLGQDSNLKRAGEKTKMEERLSKDQRKALWQLAIRTVYERHKKVFKNLAKEGR